MNKKSFEVDIDNYRNIVDTIADLNKIKVNLLKNNLALAEEYKKDNLRFINILPLFSRRMKEYN